MFYFEINLKYTLRSPFFMYEFLDMKTISARSLLDIMTKLTNYKILIQGHMSCFRKQVDDDYSSGLLPIAG
jgi:hypothetical protein